MQSQGSGIPESRYSMSYPHSHNTLTGDTGPDLYVHGPDTYAVNVLQHPHHLSHGSGGPSPGGHLNLSSPSQHQHSSKRGSDSSGHSGIVDDVTSAGQNGSQNKKTPPPNGKKTKGRVKIKMEFIDNKLRRYTTFSKRKTGIMKKAYELSTLTGTQVMLLVASETGHVYTFATRKLQPMITSEAGKALIQTCLNSPDPPSASADQRMSATGYEETELTYTLHDEDQKDSGSGDDEDALSVDESRSNSPASAETDPSYSPQSESMTRDFSAKKSGIGQQSCNTRQTNTVAVPNLGGLANLANLPGFSGLAGLSLPLPAGTNLASLLASASLPNLSLLTTGANANKETNVSVVTGPKSLPQLISLAQLGTNAAAAFQQYPKDAAATPTRSQVTAATASNSSSTNTEPSNHAKDKRSASESTRPSPKKKKK